MVDSTGYKSISVASHLVDEDQASIFAKFKVTNLINLRTYFPLKSCLRVVPCLCPECPRLEMLHKHVNLSPNTEKYKRDGVREKDIHIF